MTDSVPMHRVLCTACDRRIGWSDDKLIPHVILCERCMSHPEEVAARLAGGVL